MTEQPIDPHAELVAARERHATKLAAKHAADAGFAAATRAKQTVLDRAAAGEDVGPADLALADTAAREAGHVADLAGAVAGATRKAVEKAEIAAHHATAEAHRNDYSGAIDLHIEDAAELDRAMAAVHAVYAKYDASGIAVAVASNRARIFDAEAPARADANPTLKAIDAGHHPRVGVPLNSPPEKLIPGLFINIGAGDFRPVKWSLVEEHVRGAYARPKPLPEAAE